MATWNNDECCCSMLEDVTNRQVRLEVAKAWFDQVMFKVSNRVYHDEYSRGHPAADRAGSRHGRPRWAGGATAARPAGRPEIKEGAPGREDCRYGGATIV